MSEGRSKDPSAVPPRPPKRRGLAIWLSLVTSMTMAVVLFANDGRNLNILMKRFDIEPILRKDYPPKAELPAQAPVASRLWPLKLPLDQTHSPLAVFRPAEKRCASMAVAGQEPPEFKVDTRQTWQCVAFWTVSNEEGAPSVFLQIRGTDAGDVTSWRIKFSKGNSDGEAVITQGFLLLQAALQPSGLAEDILSVLQEQVKAMHDFQFYLGDQHLTFRREIADPSRFNLLSIQKRADRYPISPMPVLERATAPVQADQQTRASQKMPRAPAGAMP